MRRSSNSIFKSIDSEIPKWWDYIIPGVIFVIAFVCFDQAYDMKLTMFQSSDLLDCIFSGKPFDFYSYTLDIASTTGYFGRLATDSGAIYNIVIYLTMAIWTLPVYILNLLFDFQEYALILNIWGRVMVIGLSVLCAILLTKISKKITGNTIEAKWTGYSFITSPILMFCVVIFNQYDIFSVTATLLAILFYFDKKYYKFSLLISLAICYKLFPVFIFIPLILLAEKRIFKIIQYFALGLSLYVITSFLWASLDVGYNKTQSIMMPNFEFYQWIFKSELPGGAGNICIFIFCIFVISTIAYWLKPTESDFAFISIYLAGAAYISFFVFVNWHPQWVVILLPFLSLILFRMRSLKIGIILDIFVSIGFMLTNCLKFLDGSIMNETLLVSMLHHIYYGPDSNSVMNYFTDHEFTVAIPVTIFAASLCMLFLLSYKEFNKHKGDECETERRFHMYRPLFYIRAIVPLIYMLFPMVAYFQNYAQSIQ